MSSPPDLLPSPYPLVFSCGLQHLAAGSRGYRPAGTREWLMIATLDGQGVIQADRRWVTLQRGDVFLITPGTAQTYGHVRDAGQLPAADDAPVAPWTNIWVHFLPRSHWLPWLKWPAIGKGIMQLQCGPQFDEIETGLRHMIETAQRPRRLAAEAAMNGLERVLLSADELNPEQGGRMVRDARVRRAMELVAEALAEPWAVESLAGRVGLSRSRFAALFSSQVGQSPQSYIESTRLARAAQLLQSSSWQVQQIAEQVGFADPLYFSTRFRRQYGLAPAQYRARMTSDEAPAIGR
jgi:AraC family transcriptional regulator, arabinose operon regulatory protein